MSAIAHLYSEAGRTWCRVMHSKPMWPINGYYRCGTCHRQWAVSWEPHHDDAHPAPFHA